MPKFICHHEGWFFEWSTVVDAPTTLGMTRAEFDEYYRDRYGSDDFETTYPQRIERAMRTGTSCLDGSTLADLASCNRAGPRETEIPLESIIQMYCVEQRDPWAESGCPVSNPPSPPPHSDGGPD